MIVQRDWTRYERFQGFKGAPPTIRTTVWRGWFLFGLIPLYSVMRLRTFT